MKCLWNSTMDGKLVLALDLRDEFCHAEEVPRAPVLLRTLWLQPRKNEGEKNEGLMLISPLQHLLGIKLSLWLLVWALWVSYNWTVLASVPFKPRCVPVMCSEPLWAGPAMSPRPFVPSGGLLGTEAGRGGKLPGEPLRMAYCFWIKQTKNEIQLEAA